MYQIYIKHKKYVVLAEYLKQNTFFFHIEMTFFGKFGHLSKFGIILRLIYKIYTKHKNYAIFVGYFNKKYFFMLKRK